MSKIAFCVATMAPVPETPEPVLSFTTHSETGLFPAHVLYRRNTPEDNLGVVGSYQWLYEHTTAPIIAYIHDDVICREQGWDERILKEFDDPTVGVVGFGGALHHGSDDLYRTPYRLQQLARAHYLSNTDDAEFHGERFTGACDVAVLDGFALVVRRELLDRCGGWPVTKIRFHAYDYAICCLAHRYRYRVRVVGVRCHHLGGRTSTTPQYQVWAENQGLSDNDDHVQAHAYIYHEFSDVLPYRCQEVLHGSTAR